MNKRCHGSGALGSIGFWLDVALGDFCQGAVLQRGRHSDFSGRGNHKTITPQLRPTTNPSFFVFFVDISSFFESEGEVFGGDSHPIS